MLHYDIVYQTTVSRGLLRSLPQLGVGDQGAGDLPPQADALHHDYYQYH